MIRINRHRFHRLERSELFLRIEAADLSFVPFNVPYYKQLIRDRAKKLRQAVKDGWTKEQYQQSIIKDYIERGWLRRKRGRDVPDAFKLLRAYEDRYRDRQPQYESPWQGAGKRKNLKDFQAKVDKTLARFEQRQARGYA
jgi:hypothetical protein